MKIPPLRQHLPILAWILAAWGLNALAAAWIEELSNEFQSTLLLLELMALGGLALLAHDRESRLPCGASSLRIHLAAVLLGALGGLLGGHLRPLVDTGGEHLEALALVFVIWPIHCFLAYAAIPSVTGCVVNVNLLANGGIAGLLMALWTLGEGDLGDNVFGAMVVFTIVAGLLACLFRSLARKWTLSDVWGLAWAVAANLFLYLWLWTVRS